MSKPDITRVTEKAAHPTCNVIVVNMDSCPERCVAETTQPNLILQ